MGNDFGPGFQNFDTMFNVVAGLVIVVFIVVIGLFIVNAAKSASQGIKNNAAPEVTAQVTVVDKRIQLSGGGTTHSAPMLNSDGALSGSGLSHSDPVSERYFVTFQQSGGERFEMKVPAAEYGLLVVGDQGTVTMKGTRYLGFQRELMR